MQRRRATGSYAPKPSGGTISPLEAHAAFLFALIARQPGLTLDEIVAGDAQAKDRWHKKGFSWNRVGEFRSEDPIMSPML
jgi:hypothetical protein